MAGRGRLDGLLDLIARRYRRVARKVVHPRYWQQLLRSPLRTSLASDQLHVLC